MHRQIHDVTEQSIFFRYLNMSTRNRYRSLSNMSIFFNSRNDFGDLSNFYKPAPFVYHVWANCTLVFRLGTPVNHSTIAPFRDYARWFIMINIWPLCRCTYLVIFFTRVMLHYSSPTFKVVVKKWHLNHTVGKWLSSLSVVFFSSFFLNSVEVNILIKDIRIL